MGRKRGKQSRGPWYETFSKRYFFERPAFYEYPSLRVKKCKLRQKLWMQYNVNIFLKDYDVTRAVTVKLFSNSDESPEITVDGPEDSPHRYGNGQLCMWYPKANKSDRWIFSDGLLHLLVLVEAHLFREAWWRETGEWLGPERAHAGKC